GRGEGETRRRERNVDGLADAAGVAIPERVRETAVSDHEGDALDSVAAAVAVHRNLGEFAFDADSVEGRIYA
ncbi:MAG: hypothetical protein ABEH83_12895, partial [Halobacterium sp.]